MYVVPKHVRVQEFSLDVSWGGGGGGGDPGPSVKKTTFIVVSFVALNLF